MLELEFRTYGRRWQADLTSPLDLAIALRFPGPQPRFFADGPASTAPLQLAGFSGRVASGASCNCGVYTFAPHCHGTHTESVDHLTDNGDGLASLTPLPPALAVLASAQPGPLGAAAVAELDRAQPQDPVITRAALAAATARWARDPWTALVLRTLPNDAGKLCRSYDGPCPAPYFTPDAMRWVVERGVTSLVVDLPSLDRADDGGRLAAHHLYWGLPQGARDARQAARDRALVTELAYVPEHASDGLYLLSLHVPAFATDAAPSRPVLYPVRELAP